MTFGQTTEFVECWHLACFRRRSGVLNMNSIKMFISLLSFSFAVSACGFRPPSYFESDNSTSDTSGSDWSDTPALCKLYGKEPAFFTCIKDADTREQNSLKSVLRAKDASGDWSNSYFYSSDFTSRYNLSESDVGCLESVLCDQSANGN